MFSLDPVLILQSPLLLLVDLVCTYKVLNDNQGVTAAVLSLALHTIGVESKIYDGSWSEYGQESLNNPVEK